jgi:hypothetical protein
VLAVLLVAGGVLLWSRRAVKTPPLSPEGWALRELERLAALNPNTAQEVKRFHTQLADVLRRYMERRFQIPAERQTTFEFLQAMRTSPRLADGQQKLLGEILTRCDLAKFARVVPPPEECQGAVTLVRGFVQEGAAAQASRGRQPPEGVAPPGADAPGSPA